MDEAKKKKIGEGIDQLKRSLRFGEDPDIISHYDKIPEDIRTEWVNLIYSNTERFNPSVISKLITILDNPVICIPSRKKSRKTLIQLKALAETMSNLERNTNFLLHQVLNGNNDHQGSETIQNAGNGRKAASL